MIFIWFWSESKKTKLYIYFLSFSIFISLITESSYILSYIINRFIMQFFGISEDLMEMSSNILLFKSIVCYFLFN